LKTRKSETANIMPRYLFSVPTCCFLLGLLLLDMTAPYAIVKRCNVLEVTVVGERLKLDGNDWPMRYFDKPFYQGTVQSGDVCAIKVCALMAQGAAGVVLERVHAGYPDDFFVAFAGCTGQAAVNIGFIEFCVLKLAADFVSERIHDAGIKFRTVFVA